MSRLQFLTMVGGPLLAAITALVMVATAQSAAMVIVAALAANCIIWWVFEPIPIAVTSLLPLAVLPLSGVLTPAQVGEAYGSPLILLLLGGFLLSRGMEHSGAHRRIAISLVNLFGRNSGRGLVAGFMVAAALLSMWISNTATTLMLLPVALAVLDSTDAGERLAVPLLLGMAYAASVGGIGTPIGTPPNLIFMQVFENVTGESIGFTRWMSWALPVVVIMVPAMMLYLTRNVPRKLAFELPECGAWSIHEKRVLMIFALTALAWITRSEPWGGWSAWLGLSQANDASVALLAVVLLFLVRNGRGEALLTWERASTIPWGVLLLFAGGICMAKGFTSSGLSDLVATGMTRLDALPMWLLIASICLIVTFITESTSNTASTALLMPILAATADAADLPPELIMAPAAMSASCAFMLPVATAPNSVVFGSGLIPAYRMAREGLVFNFLGVLVIATVSWALVRAG